MKFFINTFLFLIIILETSTIFGDDEVKNNTKSKEINKTKIIEESEVSGMVVTYNKSGQGEPIYFIILSEKRSAKLPSKIGDKKIDFEKLNGKQAVAKGVIGDVTKESKDIEVITFTSLTSIELKEAGSSSDKKTGKDSKEETKKDPGNLPYN